MMVDALDLALGLGDELIALVAVELQDTSHLDLHQSQDIVTCHLTDKRGLERLQATVDVRDRLVHILGVLELRVLVDAFLDKDLLERGIEERLLLLLFLDQKFLPEQIERAVGRMTQHVAHGQEVGLIVLDDTTVGRETDLTISKGIKRVDRLVGRDTGCQMHEDLHVLGRIVVHLLDLDLALLVRFQYGIDHGRGRFPIRDLGDDQSLVVDLAYFRPDLHRTAPLTVIVTGNINIAARLEIGIKRERLAPQVSDRGIDQFVEVMW